MAHPVAIDGASPLGVCLVRLSLVRHDRICDQQGQHEQQQPPLSHERSTQHRDRPYQATARYRHLPWWRVETPASRQDECTGVRKFELQVRRPCSNKYTVVRSMAGWTAAKVDAKHLRSKEPLSRLKMGRRVASLRSGCLRGESGNS